MELKELISEQRMKIDRFAFKMAVVDVIVPKARLDKPLRDFNATFIAGALRVDANQYFRSYEDLVQGKIEKTFDIDYIMSIDIVEDDIDDFFLSLQVTSSDNEDFKVMQIIM